MLIRNAYDYQKIIQYDALAKGHRYFILIHQIRPPIV